MSVEDDETEAREIEIDTIVGMITHVNVRTEKHGQDSVTAVDLTVYCEQHANSPDNWASVHAQLLETDSLADAPAAAEEMTHLLAKVPFGAEYPEHVVGMWQSTKQLARWPNAKVHKFTRHPQKKLYGLAFLVSTPCTPDQGKAVLEVYNKALVRFEIAPNAPDLFSENHSAEQQPTVTH